MCDRIIMPGNRIIESVELNGSCLCNSTQEDILKYIVKNVGELYIDDTLIINRSPYGYEVDINR